MSHYRSRQSLTGHRPSVVTMMRRQEQDRALIVNGLRAGMTVKDIIQTHNKLSKSTVYLVKNKFDAFLAAGGSPESFSIDRKKHKKRSDCKAVAIAEDVRNIMRMNPGKSMRAIAVELKVHERTIRRTLKEELCYTSCAVRKGRLTLEEAIRDRRRLEKAKKLLKHPAATNMYRTLPFVVLARLYCGTNLPDLLK